MKVIKDIRIFYSAIENIDFSSFSTYLGNKKFNAIINRITMKLREGSFSLGDFDHLYINFTTCKVEGKMALAKRNVDKYHPWYRYYDVEISKSLLTQSEPSIVQMKLVKLVEQLLIKCFSSEQYPEEFIRNCFTEALLKGENMLMCFKEKSTSKRKAIVYLRYFDDCKYYPLLRVFDINGNLLLEKELPSTIDFGCLGEIQLSSKRVAIKPRKNVFSKALDPICYDY